MARRYSYEFPGWPSFKWDSKALAPLLSEVRLRQGLLVGKMRSYGLVSRWTATLRVLTEETIKSSAIEGVVLDPENVRSSLARRLRLEVGGLTAHKDQYIDGVVEMILDATQQFSKPLTKERLFDWHAHLFPGVRTTRDKFRVGAWRDDAQGPMQVVSGPVGRQDVYKRQEYGIKGFHGDSAQDHRGSTSRSSREGAASQRDRRHPDRPSRAATSCGIADVRSPTPLPRQGSLHADVGRVEG